ncbi:MAG: DUF983 domain-containing protein [Actinomycetota bacterium]|nr:DUF983 domain-containing protein [Actinomycetota bacterium]
MGAGGSGRPGLAPLVRRALLRRCPVCGGSKIFAGWFKLKPNCPTCSYRFERESGYWVSAIIVNTAVTEALFGLFFVGVLIATFPDVSWGPVLLVGALTNVIFPVFFFPLSKTLLMAFDLWVNPLNASEQLAVAEPSKPPRGLLG